MGAAGYLRLPSGRRFLYPFGTLPLPRCLEPLVNAPRSTALVSCLLAARSASAFCGFYVSGGGAELFNDASMVVLVRDGTRTVLSMQNDYRGPPEDFALVVPVPVVLEKANVQTIPREAFKRIDELTSPRLVEQPRSPCTMGIGSLSFAGGAMGGVRGSGAGLPRDLGVKVEAKFEVEEYEIVILSAKFSLGLEIWLAENKFKIPKGAAAALQPYVQAGMKFFVAKVNAKKAKLVDGRAVLSPLRFFYDSEQFSLPIRLGLLNSSGSQDLIVHVIAKSRYELANAPNVLVPTNVDVRTRASAQFGGFYKELLSRTFQKNPKAAVTEFAWEGALPPPQQMVGGGIYGVTCDPCPPPHPVDNPLARYLGVGLLPKIKTDDGITAFVQGATVTRLHLRYTKESAPDDLVFKAVDPIAGGTPEMKEPGPSTRNRFQGRYVMWVDGCGSGRGMFGAPNSLSGGATSTGTELVDPFEQVLVSDLPELGVKAQPLSKDAKPLPYLAPAPPPIVQPTFAASGPTGRVTVAKLEGPEAFAPQARKVLEQAKNALRYCYERVLRMNPNVSGALTIAFTVAPTGAVSTASLDGAGVDPSLDACLVSRVRAQHFPQPAEPTTLRVRLSFAAQ